MARKGQMTVDTMTDGCRKVLSHISKEMQSENGQKQYPQTVQKHRVRLAYARYCLGELSYVKAICYAFNLSADEYAAQQLDPDPNQRPRFKFGTIVAMCRKDLETHSDAAVKALNVNESDVTLPAIAEQDRRKGGRGGAGGFGSTIFG